MGSRSNAHLGGNHNRRRNAMRFALVILALCLAVQAKTKASPIAPSHASLVRQNLAVDQMGLHRFQNEDEVQEATRRGTLIALPITLGDRKSTRLNSSHLG